MEPVSEPGDPSPDVLRPSLFAAVLANARNAMAALLPFFLSSFLPSSFLQIVKKKICGDRVGGDGWEDKKYGEKII